MISFKEQEFGLSYHWNNTLIFFGNSKFNLDSMSVEFPLLKPSFIKQTHGDQIVNSSNEICEADAHYTQNLREALIIKTADCLPIFCMDTKGSTVLGIHAGWRGVANQIVIKSLSKLKEEGVNISDLKVIIGPHIMEKSFEVDSPVLEQLLQSLPTDDLDSKNYFETLNNGKFKVNLQKIILRQLNFCGVSLKSIVNNEIDTVTNLNWNSYRRDKENSGRNLSFITKLC